MIILIAKVITNFTFLNNYHKLPLLRWLVLLLIISCGEVSSKKNIFPSFNHHNQPVVADDILIDLQDSMIADGFDFPVGNIDGSGSYTSKLDKKVYDSWVVSTRFLENYSLGIHTGLDINGAGGGNTDLGQPVFAIAKGIVIDAHDYGAPWGGVVLIKHIYHENAKLITCYSLYAHMENLLVEKNQRMSKRQQIGEIGTGKGSFPAHLHFEIRKNNMKDFPSTFWPSDEGKNVNWMKAHYDDPYDFIKTKRKLTSPFYEEKIIIAIKNKYKLYYYVSGKLIKEYEIALSQNPLGHKKKEGDLKLPEGEYYICEKQKGPFHGKYSEFLGPCLLRTSYPNIYDAQDGYKSGLITKNEMNKIIAANLSKEISPKNTKLGGGIVIHGWSGDWIADGKQDLTWGCISMHNTELQAFYELISLKTKILILP